MELLDKKVRTEIFGDRAIYTKVNDSSPAKFADTAKVKNSLIADGCIIEGTVRSNEKYLFLFVNCRSRRLF